MTDKAAYNEFGQDANRSKQQGHGQTLSSELLRTYCQFVEISHPHSDTDLILREFASKISRITGFDAVGIRSFDQNAGAFYKFNQGFSKYFFESETLISIHLDHCMRAKSFRDMAYWNSNYYTEGGSFYTNITRRCTDILPEKLRSICERYNEYGYGSVAVVPIMLGQSIYGIIQVADPRENLIPLDMVHFLEGVAILLGATLSRTHAEHRLRASEEKYRTIFEHSRDAIVLTTKEGRFVDMNQAALDLFAYTREEMSQLDVRDMYVNPLDRERFLKKVDQEGYVKDYELRFRRKDRSEMDTLDTSALRKPNEYQGIIRDITEQKKAVEALRESEEKYRSLFEESRDAIYISTREGKFVDVNQAALDLFSYTRQEMLELDIQGIYINRHDRLKFQKEIESTGYVRDYEIKLKKKDGTQMTCLLTTTVRKSNDAKILGYQGIIRDITEQKMADEKLLAYQEHLRSLASELSLIEERERRRIATFLHDDIGQTLAISKIKLGALKKSAAFSKSPTAVEELNELIEKAVQNTRSLTFELSPPVLYELGFEAAVEWLAEKFQGEHGIEISFETDRQPKPLDDDVRIVLFQGVRELLMNVVKHAHASRASITIWRNGKNIEIEVEDNGVGFHYSEIDNNVVKTTGFGLFSIRERLDHLGGQFQIQSNAGHGSRLTLVAPLRIQEKTTKEKTI